jgi:hypothetical protein
MKGLNMGIITQLKNYRVNWIDVALIKITVFAGTLFIAKLWNPILSLEWYWYLTIWIFAAIEPFNSFLKGVD